MRGHLALVHRDRAWMIRSWVGTGNTVAAEVDDNHHSCEHCDPGLDYSMEASPHLSTILRNLDLMAQAACTSQSCS